MANQRAIVLDAAGRELDPCPLTKARRLIEGGSASLVREAPFTIQLDRVVDIPQPQPEPQAHPYAGQRLLLHICCAPCSTYSVKRLRQVGFDVTGFWYNPNIHPWQEHERRRTSLQAYSGRIGLPMIWHPDYEMPAFMRRVVGQEAFRQRCAACYEMRLEEAARQARLGGYAAFTTTLLISPYQDQEAIRRLGEKLGHDEGVEFYYENLRSGWAERSRMTAEHGLYRQQYCGCIYSEWERYTGKHIESGENI